MNDQNEIKEIPRRTADEDKNEQGVNKKRELKEREKEMDRKGETKRTRHGLRDLQVI